MPPRVRGKAAAERSREPRLYEVTTGRRVAMWRERRVRVRLAGSIQGLALKPGAVAIGQEAIFSRFTFDATLKYPLLFLQTTQIVRARWATQSRARRRWWRW